VSVIMRKPEIQISLLEDNDCDTNAILDRYVQLHPHGSIYHHSAWRNAIRSAYKHRSVVCIAKNEQQIVGILPLCCMSVPVLGSSLVALPFADYGGVLADEEEIATQLVAEAKRQLIKLKAKKLELRTTVLASQQAEEMLPSAINTEHQMEQGHAKVRMLVQLPASAELLLAGYKPKLRSQIKKAQKNGLNAAIVDDEASLKQFYCIYTRNMHRLGSPVHSLDWFIALRRNLLALDAFKIVLVSYQQQVVGAGIILHFGDYAWLPWASTLTDYNHLAPNMLMYWQIQAYLSDKGVRVFDMGRSTIGEGTYRFKAQWGAVADPLCWTVYRPTDIADSEETKIGSVKLRRLAEKMWRLLPLPVATACGAYLRRYISL